MPAPLTLQELEAQLRDNKNAGEELGRNLEKGTEIPRPERPLPLSIPDASRLDLMHVPGKADFDTSRKGRLNKDPEDVSPPAPNHSEQAVMSDRWQRLRLLGLLNLYSHNVARNEEQEKKWAENREPISVGVRNRKGYEKGIAAQNVKATREEDQEAHLNFPAYSQAYDTKEGTGHSGRALGHPLKLPPGLIPPQIPGLRQHVPPRPSPPDSKVGALGRQEETKFLPVIKSAFFPEQSLSPPRDPSSEDMLDTLRTKFDNKLSLLEERMEHKIGTDARSLSTIRDLESRLAESEKENESYKARIVELEKKLAMMKG